MEQNQKTREDLEKRKKNLLRMLRNTLNESTNNNSLILSDKSVNKIKDFESETTTR